MMTGQGRRHQSEREEVAARGGNPSLRCPTAGSGTLAAPDADARDEQSHRTSATRQTRPRDERNSRRRNERRCCDRHHRPSRCEPGPRCDDSRCPAEDSDPDEHFRARAQDAKRRMNRMTREDIAMMMRMMMMLAMMTTKRMLTRRTRKIRVPGKRPAAMRIPTRGPVAMAVPRPRMTHRSCRAGRQAAPFDRVELEQAWRAPSRRVRSRGRRRRRHRCLSCAAEASRFRDAEMTACRCCRCCCWGYGWCH